MCPYNKEIHKKNCIAVFTESVFFKERKMILTFENAAAINKYLIEKLSGGIFILKLNPPKLFTRILI